MTRFMSISAAAVSLLALATPAAAQDVIVQPGYPYIVQPGPYGRVIIYRALPMPYGYGYAPRYMTHHPSGLDGFLDPRNFYDNSNIAPEFAPFD